MESAPKINWKKAEETAAIKITKDDLADHDKIRQARPTREQLIGEFGEGSYKAVGKDKEGREKYRIDVAGRKNVGKLFEIYAREQKLKGERAQKVQARLPEVNMLDKNGQPARIRPWNADYAGRVHGFTERHYWGRPSYRKVYNS